MSCRLTRQKNDACLLANWGSMIRHMASKVCACYAERGNRRAETLPWNLDLRHVASIFRQDSHTRLTDAVFPSIQLNSGIVVADSGTFSVWPPSRSFAQCPGHIRDPLPFLLWMGLTWCNACSDVSVGEGKSVNVMINGKLFESDTLLRLTWMECLSCLRMESISILSLTTTSCCDQSFTPFFHLKSLWRSSLIMKARANSHSVCSAISMYISKVSNSILAKWKKDQNTVLTQCKWMQK